MGTRTIKRVDDSTWKSFKDLAEKEDKNMGEMLRKVIEQYTKDIDDSWNKILYGKKLLTDEEAENMMNSIKRWRKEYGWRI